MSANSSFRRRSVTLSSLRPLRGSKARSTLAIPLRSYSESTRCGLPGLEASGSRTSANRAGRGSGRSRLLVWIRIVGLLVEVQDLFHPPHELGVVLGWDHPLLDQVRLEAGFLSVLRTVSCETFSTIPSSTALSAKSLKLQRLRPRGGSEQAKAIRCASARPSKERL